MESIIEQKRTSAEVAHLEHSQASSIQEVKDISEYIPNTEEERLLVRKIDLYLLPTIWLMYLLSYMDRTNLGNAKIAGMSDDLGLDSGRYSIVLVVFFIGYVLCEVPSNMILTCSRPSVFLPTIMFLWGIVTMGMGWVPSYNGLAVFRVVIGCLEAGFAPGVLLLLSSWYKRNEQSKRFAFYISAAILSGAFGGILAGAITSGLDGVYGIAGWRWLFIVEGAMSAAWAIVASFILLDFPGNSKGLTPRERQLAIQRIQSESHSVKTADGSEISHMKALGLALKNWRTWAFTVGYMVIVGSSTLSYFYPTLVQGLGYTAQNAQYMTVPIYACAFVCTAITGFFTDSAPHLRGIITSIWLAFSMICAIITCVVYNYVARYVLLVLMASGLWATNALSLSYASSTFGIMPNETRAIALAFVNAMGNLAQIYGAYLFPSNDAPKYILGFSVISAMCAVGVIAYAGLHIGLRRWPLSN